MIVFLREGSLTFWVKKLKLHRGKDETCLWLKPHSMCAVRLPLLIHSCCVCVWFIVYGNWYIMYDNCQIGRWKLRVILLGRQRKLWNVDDKAKFLAENKFNLRDALHLTFFAFILSIGKIKVWKNIIFKTNKLATLSNKTIYLPALTPHRPNGLEAILKSTRCFIDQTMSNKVHHHR